MRQQFKYRDLLARVYPLLGASFEFFAEVKGNLSNTYKEEEEEEEEEEEVFNGIRTHNKEKKGEVFNGIRTHNVREAGAHGQPLGYS